MAMTYRVIITMDAARDLEKLAKSEPKAYTKAMRFVSELREHPTMGTGHPEPLKGFPPNRWSREITKKHRLVYRVYKDAVYVEVLTAYGHYDDK